jgi:hypothetical protein
MAFLTARWSNLVLVTYAVPAQLLQHRPDELELDTAGGSGAGRNGRCIRYAVAHPTWRCHPVD